MIEFLYGNQIDDTAANIQAVEPDGSHNSHQWEISILWEYDEEPTWYILRAWAGERYTVWALWQDTYDDMLLSIKLRTRY